MTLRLKFKVVTGSWMYATLRIMVLHLCAKYGKPRSNQKEVMGRKGKHVKHSLNLTLRLNFKVVSGHIVSWWYIQEPNMVSQCQTKKKVMGRTRICTDRLTGRRTTDRETDRQSGSYIPLEFCSRGYNYIDVKRQINSHYNYLCISFLLLN